MKKGTRCWAAGPVFDIGVWKSSGIQPWAVDHWKGSINQWIAGANHNNLVRQIQLRNQGACKKCGPHDLKNMHLVPSMAEIIALPLWLHSARENHGVPAAGGSEHEART